MTKKRAGVPRLPHLLGIEGLSPETISGLLDLSETYIDQNTYHVRMALPGIRPEEVNLQVHQNLLTISGERKQEQKVSDERYLQREFTYGQFERTVPLPEGVQSEKVEAHYRDGVLDVTVPVSEKALPRRIEIKSEGKTAKPLAA